MTLLGLQGYAQLHLFPNYEVWLWVLQLRCVAIAAMTDTSPVGWVVQPVASGKGIYREMFLPDLKCCHVVAVLYISG